MSTSEQNLSDRDNEPIRVIDNPGLHRYEVSYPDTPGAPAGFAEYLDTGGDRIFYHTEVGEEFGGRGLAGALIGEALRDTTARGLQIVPVCPFVKGYVSKNSVAGTRPAGTADLMKLRDLL